MMSVPSPPLRLRTPSQRPTTSSPLTTIHPCAACSVTDTYHLSCQLCPLHPPKRLATLTHTASSYVLPTPYSTRPSPAGISHSKTPPRPTHQVPWSSTSTNGGRCRYNKGSGGEGRGRERYFEVDSMGVGLGQL
jgi:hypothetical protein